MINNESKDLKRRFFSLPLFLSVGCILCCGIGIIILSFFLLFMVFCYNKTRIKKLNEFLEENNEAFYHERKIHWDIDEKG